MTPGPWTLRLLSLAVFATLFSSVAPLAAQESGQTRRALLVGVEAYDGALGWTKLRGPRRDLAAMRTALLAQGFREADIRLLVDEQATHAGIIDAFDELIAESSPEDVLLFYFAGHGSILADRDGDELDDLDETLIPFDASLPNGEPNDILDDELRAMITRANQRTDHVVFILDCCSSGTIVRGEDTAVSRFVDPQTRGLKGVRKSSTVAAAEEQSSGYAEPGASYVALSACRSSESAYEVRLTSPAGEPEYRGLFTYHLIQELNSGEALSYEALLQNTRDRIQKQRQNQTPLAEGPLMRRALFGQSDLVQAFAFALELDENGPRLHAGQTNGLEPGSILAVYADSATAASQAEPLARIRLTDVGPVSASFDWEGEAPEFSKGSRLLALLESGSSSGLKIAVLGPLELPSTQALIGALGESKHLVHATEKNADLFLRWNPAPLARWEVESSKGTDLGLAARAADTDELDELLRVLELLGRSHRVASTVTNRTAEQLKVETAFERLGADGQPIGALQLEANGMPALRPGESFGCRLTNRSDVPLYATLLVFSPDGEIAILQAPQNMDDAIPPGETYRSPSMSLVLNKGSEPFYRDGTESFRWVVTKSFHDLRNLCQPSVRASRPRGFSDAPSEPTLNGLGSQDWLTVTSKIRLVIPE